MIEPKFPLGRIVATPGALDLIAEQALHPMDFVLRHVSGEWGDLTKEDCRANNRALTDGGRIFSVYRVKDDQIWVITEWDRSVTTLLLPDEY